MKVEGKKGKKEEEEEEVCNRRESLGKQIKAGMKTQKEDRVKKQRGRAEEERRERGAEA